MAKTIVKLFQFIQKFNRVIGIDATAPLEKTCFANNWKILMFFVCELQFMAALTAFLFSGAKTISEYGTTFFALSSSTLALIVHFFYSRQIRQYSMFIGKCEGFIEKSKCLCLSVTWRNTDSLDWHMILILLLVLWVRSELEENAQRLLIKQWMESSNYFAN